MFYQNNGYGPIDRFCARHPRFGIPNLMMYLVIAQVAVYLVSLFFPGFASLLAFHRTWIARGQIWRLVTFVFLPKLHGQPLLPAPELLFLLLDRPDAGAGLGDGQVHPVLPVRRWCCPSSPGLLLGYAEIYYVNLSIFLISPPSTGRCRCCCSSWCPSR